MTSVTQLPLWGTIEIPLNRGYKVIVDAIDGDLAQLKWCITTKEWPYARRAIRAEGKQRIVFMHRLVLERTLGRSLSIDERPDHINGNIHDNRRSNLRAVSDLHNHWNIKRSARNTSGVKGVYFSNGHWRANISVNGKRFHLGYYETIDDAAKAYEKASIELHGEFRRI